MNSKNSAPRGLTCAHVGYKTYGMYKSNVSSGFVLVLSAALLSGCATGSDDVRETDQVEGASGGEENSSTFVAATTIGPQGGALTLDDGFGMVIPAGALAASTRIEIHRLTQPPKFAKGPAYRVEPVGLLLTSPAQVTVPVVVSDLPPNTQQVLHGYASPSGVEETYEPVSTTTSPDDVMSFEVSELGYYTSGSPFPHVIAAGEDYPRRIATDATHVYWSSSGNLQRKLDYGNDGVVVRAPIGGGLVEVLTTPQPDPVGVAVNDQHVYWVNGGDGALWEGEGSGGAVMRLPKAGGTPEKLSDEAFPQAIALDATHVYWSDAENDEIRRMPLDGGAVTVLASNQGDPRHLALSDTDVFYTTGEMGVVARVPKTGGVPAVLSSEGGKTTAITVSDGYVYWTNEMSGAVRRVSAYGGTPITIREATRPTALVVNGSQLYFTDLTESNLYKMSVTGGMATILATDQALPWDVKFHAGTNQLILASAGKYDFEGELARVALP